MLLRYARINIFRLSVMTTLQPLKMVYNNFGNSGIKISQLSFGNAINYRPETYEEDKKIIQCCLKNGINHFDTAEIYAYGECQSQLGKILQQLKVPRQHVVIATKINSAFQPQINSTRSTNRKHIRQSIKKCLNRLQMDYVDILYAHHYDYNTPMEEICRGFHEVIEEGSAFYWATSNWYAEEVIEALAVCQRLNLHKPIGNQRQYNMLDRFDQEVESKLLFEKHNYGLISWGSMAGGFLTQKHLNGPSENIKTRFNDSSLWFGHGSQSKVHKYEKNNTEENLNKLKELHAFAQSYGFSLNHLALAWVMKFKHLDSALVGAKNVAQFEDSLKALELLEKFTPEFQGKVNKILGNTPQPRINFLTWTQYPPIRPVA